MSPPPMAIKIAPTERDAGRADASEADIDTLRVGQTAACDVRVTQRLINAFARLSADSNRLHTDAEVAKSYGFERPVAHGLLPLAAISRLIGTRLPGHGALLVSQDLRFPSPVLAGDQLTARVTVEQISMSTGLVVLRTEVTNVQSGAVVLSGMARVKIPNRRSNIGATSMRPERLAT